MNLIDVPQIYYRMFYDKNGVYSDNSSRTETYKNIPIYYVLWAYDF